MSLKTGGGGAAALLFFFLKMNAWLRSLGKTSLISTVWDFKNLKCATFRLVIYKSLGHIVLYGGKSSTASKAQSRGHDSEERAHANIKISLGTNGLLLLLHSSKVNLTLLKI